jgi:ABC-2 type transport system permease protein
VNELLKISKKLSVYIMLIIMIAGMFVTAGIFKYSQAKLENSQSQANTQSGEDFTKNAMNRSLTVAQTQLSQINGKIAQASPAQKKQSEVQATDLQYQIDSMNTAIHMGVYLYSDYYVALALQDVASYKSELNDLQALPADALTQPQKDEEALLTSLIPQMQAAATNKDFKEYTEVINQKLNADTSMSQTDKDIQLEQNNLRLKYNVTNEEYNTALQGFSSATVLGVTSSTPPTPDDIITDIGTARKSLAYNLDYMANQSSPVPLTPERRIIITDDIAVYLKQLETGAIQTDNFTLMNDIMATGIFVIELLLLILAGGTISQELSTGSIKSLVISPTKRWKIYFAKLLSLIAVGAIAAILCYGAGILVFGAFFGLGHASPYIYVSLGKALLMNFYLFTLAKMFIGLVPVLFYLVLALMLSTITRNTAVSVGISIGVLFGSTIAYPILTSLLTGEWLKFIPFSNFDFAAKIFPLDPSISASFGVNTTLIFSAIYVIAFIAIMFYIGLDSFTRRDIK